MIGMLNPLMDFGGVSLVQSTYALDLCHTSFQRLPATLRGNVEVNNEEKIRPFQFVVKSGAMKLFSSYIT